METIITNMCMIENELGEVVVQRRVKNWKGCVFPGGKVESNESFIDAVIREIKEETNLTIKNVKLVGLKQYSYKGILYIVILYKTKDFDGELRSSDEGEVFWYKKEDLHKLDSPSDFSGMIEVFEQDDISEMQLFEKDGKWEAIIK